MTEQTYDFQGPMTDEKWAVIDQYLTNLPRPVRLVVWASERNSCTEGDAVYLAQTLAERYDHILQFRNRPRRANYSYYPVLGVMGLDENGKEIDYGIRFVGLPAWYHINSLIGAIQAVSFRASTTEAKTRIILSRLPADEELRLQLFTVPEDEAGVPMATLMANMAVASPQIRCWIVMLNDFPDMGHRYSIYSVPHTIVNERSHLQGVFDEEQLIKQIVKVVKAGRLNQNKNDKEAA